MDANLKTCSCCKAVKPLSEYNKHGSTKDRLQTECKTCHNERRQVARKAKLGCYATERERYRDSHLMACRKTYYKAKRQVFEHYCPDGPRCAICGFADSRALSLDHINGDGAEHRRTLKGVNLYRWVVRNNFPSNFQVLCMNCQWIKRHTELGFEEV